MTRSRSPSVAVTGDQSVPARPVRLRFVRLRLVGEPRARAAAGMGLEAGDRGPSRAGFLGDGLGDGVVGVLLDGTGPAESPFVARPVEDAHLAGRERPGLVEGDHPVQRAGRVLTDPEDQPAVGDDGPADGLLAGADDDLVARLQLLDPDRLGAVGTPPARLVDPLRRQRRKPLECAALDPALVVVARRDCHDDDHRDLETALTAELAVNVVGTDRGRGCRQVTEGTGHTRLIVTSAIVFVLGHSYRCFTARNSRLASPWR